MTTFRSVYLAGVLAVGIAGGVSAVRANDLPSGVKSQVSSSIASWHVNGNVSALRASIKDLCSENPGIALDVVAYAGEVAASSGSPERCLVSDSNCTTLEDLLSLLYMQAERVTSGTRTASIGRIVLPPAPPSGGSGSGSGETGGSGDTSGSGGNDGADNSNMPPPCQTSGPCGGEPPPASLSAL